MLLTSEKSDHYIWRMTYAHPHTNMFATLLTSEIAPANSLAGLFAPGIFPFAPATAQRPWKWFYVCERFSQFLATLAITEGQREDGETKQAGIRNCLNRHYWGCASDNANSMLIGSWGKQTRVRPSRDIDILFLLPPHVYWRFQETCGNRQSQLLQEVKTVLSQTYSQTTMRADGQVVMIPFNTILVEIAPGFRCQDGSIIVCDQRPRTLQD